MDNPELTYVGGVTQRCVSLAQGTLSPDMRVNYEFGLVLGVDEFRQEQMYFLHKDYLHNRALHGYGTVSGLRMTLEPSGGSDVKVNVFTGIGIDQCGRVFVVRNDQCAYMRAWFERQRNNEAADLTPGVKRLYVVATYDECPDALVSIAGQPCSSSQQSQVASRIRDSFQIALRWQPPAMPTWDAIQCFAELMADVRVEANLPQSQSDKAEIIELVRLLDDCDAVRERRAAPGFDSPLTSPVDSPIDTGSRYLYLPEATAQDDLDDIFRIWVTEVRPRLEPDVIACGFDSDDVETGVLLAEMRVMLDFDAAGNPVVTIPDEAVRDSGRPFLLGTQLIQELMMLGEGGSALPQREFATLNVRDNRSLMLWIHHPEPITMSGDFTQYLTLLVNGVERSGTIQPVSGFDNTYTLEVEGVIEAGARVELRFHLNQMRAGTDGRPTMPEIDPSLPGLEPVRPSLPGDLIPTRPGDLTPVIPGPGNRPGLPINTDPTLRRRLESLADARAIAGSTALLASIDLFGFDYVGRVEDTIVIYAIADSLPDVRQLLTMDTRSGPGLARPELLLWFHTEMPVLVPADAVKVRRIRGSNATDFQFDMAPAAGGANQPTEQWILRPRQAFLQDGDLIELIIDANLLQLSERMTVFEAMQRGQYTYVGHDGTGMIETFGVVDIPPTATGGLTEEEVRKMLDQVRTLSFATITEVERLDDFLLRCELWFHPDVIVDQPLARLQEPNFRVYMEAPEAGEIVQVEVQDLTRIGFNHFIALIDGSRLANLDKVPTYARFVFPLDEGNVIETRNGAFNLREYMQRFNIKFDGYFVNEQERREEALVIYVRLSGQGQRG
ncbi:MAG: hypothetical protein CL610_02675 [Anaerolineaceae bacterium]|nr:hypothetical protein [Anaerolineaceae bacterium]